MIEEARVVAEQDLTSSVQMLEEAYGLDPDPELMNEILLRKDALKKLDQARDRFWNKYREDKLYSAYQILLGLPDNYRFDQEEEILHSLQEKFEKAESLVREAKRLPATEHQLALEKFREASQLMADFPGLAAEIAAFERTVEQGNAYLVAITKAIEKGQLSKASSLLKRYRQGYGDDDNAALLEQQISRRISDMGRIRSIRRILVALFLVLASITVLAGGVIFHDYRNLDESEKLWSEVKEFRAAGRFVEASRKSEEIVNLLENVYLLDLPRKELLVMQAKRFLESQHRREGLAGRLLVEGGYVSREMTKEARKLEKLVIKAEEALSLGDPESATRNYGLALELARRLKVPEERLARLSAGLKKARVEFVRERIEKVGSRFGPEQYEKALEAYRRIQKDIDAYGLGSEPVAARLSQAFNRTARARLKGLEAAGARAFAMGDFNTAVKLNQEALVFASANSIADAVTANRINDQISRALVSSILSQAQALQRAGQLSEALGAYRQALQVAKERNLIGYEPVAQAEKEVFELSLTLDRQYLDQGIVDARAALDRDDIETAAATLRRLEDRLAASDFLGTPALESQARNITALAQDLAEQTYVREHSEYLKKNYAGIIRKAFGLAKDTILLNPEIIMVRIDEEKLVFSISAYSYVKSGEVGNYTAYHLNYALNRGDGSWEVESRDLEERKESDRPF